ncbi:putative secreted protein (Por secretion system target) [Pontibacter ummariensis]|uniref:Por secretion system C-terminal sorting domain-containing protein n=1 Tax=Pontibacter ummariensis TaxID=1610492 RepID=A0A239E0J5_9BACT|nr:T9SS type A sorting domain-containing protein [Pontibacter ummariensis]PRY13663.1 putative secreted protein (Por secretion system target) [Pontibacter ummariensis]SNS38029.1 Por secretion system C-terminal sorting domain-containing protein [Pontibacter ummariensis]
MKDNYFLFPFLYLSTFLISIKASNAQTFSSNILSKEGVYSNTTILQDYDGDGDLDIIATEKDPDQLIWIENEPNRQFSKRIIISSGVTWPSDLDAADLDKDGDTDYLVSSGSRSTGYTGELAWFQRQSDESYTKHIITSAKDFDRAVIADLNKDGNVDIIAIGFDQDLVQAFMNDGSLSFTPKTIYDMGRKGQIDQVAVEDIDADGDMDIAFGNGIDEGKLYINDGNAGFTLGAELFAWNDLSASAGHGDMEIVDLNNDGTKDIITFTGAGTGGLYFLDGSNAYNQTVIDREVVDTGGDLVIADFDHNGLVDIVRQHWTKGFISILYQTAPLQFSKEYLELNWDSEQDESQMSVGDLDNDGDLDLVVPDGRTIDRDISWFENINGKLYRHYLYSKLIGARTPKLADFDKDGDLDIFLTVTENAGPSPEDEVVVFENINGANFINWRLHDNIDYPADLEIADIDGDGDMDAFVTARDAGNLLWLRNDGTKGSWIANTIEENADAPMGIAAADIDKDGDVDVALCSSDDAKVYWYSNNGSGTFTRSTVDANLSSPTEIEISDLNNDGISDFVVISTQAANAVTTYINNGNNGFTRQVIYTVKPARDLETGDWDMDGDQDITISVFTEVLSTTDPADIVLLENNGTGSFTSTVLISEGEKINAIDLSDMDMDGDPDIIMSNEKVGVSNLKLLTVGINTNGEIGQLVPTSVLESGTVYGIEAGNVDGDENLEIVYADFNRDDLVLINVELLLGLPKAERRFQTQVHLYPNPSTHSVTIKSASTQVKLRHYTIFDVTGKIVSRGRLTEKGNINLHNFSAQTYFILIETNKGAVTKKLLKQ